MENASTRPELNDLDPQSQLGQLVALVPGNEVAAIAWDQLAKNQRADAIETLRADLAQNPNPLNALLVASLLELQGGDANLEVGLPYLLMALRAGIGAVQSMGYERYLRQRSDLEEEWDELRRLLAVANSTFDPLLLPVELLARGRVVLAFQHFIDTALSTSQASIESAAQEVRALRDDIAATNEQAHEHLDKVVASSTEFHTELEAEKRQIIGAAAHLTKYIDAARDAQTAQFYKTEAEEFRSAEWRTWLLGIGIAAAAVAIAVVPVYFRWRATGTEITSTASVSAHLGLVATLGGLAGIVFSRARRLDSRYRKARTLEITLSAMFAYADKIEDDEQRQGFLNTMGAAILTASLGEPQDDGQRSLRPSSMFDSR